MRLRTPGMTSVLARRKPLCPARATRAAQRALGGLLGWEVADAPALPTPVYTQHELKAQRGGRGTYQHMPS